MTIGRIKNSAMDVQKPECSRCRFWDKDKHSPRELGWCRINPPVRDDESGLGYWPRTSPAEWCGKFETRKAT
jgi:hypothetical protein